MKNIVILISGGGSNMAAIVRAARRDGWNERLGTRVAAVISNRADAGGLTLARERGIATVVVDHKAFGSREAFDNALKAEIDAFEPTLVVLAGFMRILTPAFVAHFEGRLLNIHPSLLPAFPGLHAIEQALPAARWWAPRCTGLRPIWIMVRSWHRPRCRCCRATRPNPWRRAS